MGKLTANLKTNTIQMTDIIKHKTRIEVVNIHTADPKANASVFLFFSTAHFLNTILASRTNCKLILPDTQTDPSQNQKSHFLPTLDRTKNFLI